MIEFYKPHIYNKFNHQVYKKDLENNSRAHLGKGANYVMI